MLSTLAMAQGHWLNQFKTLIQRQAAESASKRNADTLSMAAPLNHGFTR
jgi:hypothetical protein